MRFYSYEYLQNQITVTNWIQILFVIFLIIFLILNLQQYYKGKRETKYRELAIITMIVIFLTLGIKISQYQMTAVVDNQYKMALYFIELISKDLGIDKKEIYINTAASIDGAIIKVQDDFYRIITEEEIERYLLEKIELYKVKVELLEVK